MTKASVSVLFVDCLLYRKLYGPEVYERHKDQCTDTGVVVFRKTSA